LEEQNRELLGRVGYAAGMIEEMLPLLRKAASAAEMIEDLKAALPAHDPAFAGQLRAYQDGLGRLVRARSRDEARSAGQALAGVAQAAPRSAAARVAVAAAQAVGHDLAGAEQSLTGAASLRPQDADLRDLKDRTTRASRHTT